MPITPPPLDLISAYGIASLAVVVALMWTIVMSAGRPVRAIGLAIGVAIVMCVSAVAASSGLLQRFDVSPPPMAFIIVGVLVLGVAVGASPIGRDAAATRTLGVLVGLQAFRLPLELVMHRASTVGVMPPELSYSGYNFDIVTGATALVLGGLLTSGARVPKRVVWLWNIWGIACLIAITVIAVLSSPIVRAFGDDPRHVNTWVLFFPYVWLPVVLVTAAISGHVVVTRKLMAG